MIVLEASPDVTGYFVLAIARGDPGSLESLGQLLRFKYEAPVRSVSPHELRFALPYRTQTDRNYWVRGHRWWEDLPADSVHLEIPLAVVPVSGCLPMPVYPVSPKRRRTIAPAMESETAMPVLRYATPLCEDRQPFVHLTRRNLYWASALVPEELRPSAEFVRTHRKRGAEEWRSRIGWRREFTAAFWVESHEIDPLGLPRPVEPALHRAEPTADLELGGRLPEEAVRRFCGGDSTDVEFFDQGCRVRAVRDSRGYRLTGSEPQIEWEEL